MNETVMITGAAGTLGRAVAAAFAKTGARLALLDIAAKGLEASYGKDNDKQILIAADLGDQKTVKDAVAKVTAKFGPVAVLCNVAGGFNMGPTVHETPDELWQGMMDINVRTLLNTVRGVVPGMLAAGSGKIVNIAAMGGVTGRGNMGAYSAAKSVVIKLTESMSAELREQGINVNCVMPSIIDTPANRADMPKADPKKWVAPEALADVIVFLASDKARAIHGAAIPVVGLS